MKKPTTSSATLKSGSSTLEVFDRRKGDRRQAASEEDKELLLKQMALALCRQYIMWPTTGPLPCQKSIACDKSHSCRKMAEDVVDYASGFPKN